MSKSLFGELKVILRHSTTYAVSNFLSRIVSFVMIPVYTRFLSPYDYGVLELITVTINVLSIVLTGGTDRGCQQVLLRLQRAAG